MTGATNGELFVHYGRRVWMIAWRLAAVVFLIWLFADVVGARSDHVSVRGRIDVGSTRDGVAMYILVDCHGKPCGDKLPDDAIRATGRSGDAKDDARVARWLEAHDGKRVRITWEAEP